MVRSRLFGVVPCSLVYPVEGTYHTYYPLMHCSHNVLRAHLLLQMVFLVSIFRSTEDFYIPTLVRQFSCAHCDARKIDWAVRLIDCGQVLRDALLFTV